MYYLALLIGPQQERTPDEAAQELTDYLNFQAKAASSIRAGDALYPEADSVRVTGGPDAPVITDGPFAEGAEVANGYYVLEADNLDDALALARDIPEAKRGAVEVWPLVDCSREFGGKGSTSWLALLLEPADRAYVPGSPEWEAVAARHGVFGEKASGHIKIAGPLHPRRRLPRSGCVTARPFSPTARTSREPRSRTASMSSPPMTATAPSGWPRRYPHRPCNCGNSPASLAFSTT